MAKLKLRDLAPILDFEADKELGDPTLGPLIALADVEQKIPFDLRGVTFSIGGDAEISVLNDPSDVVESGADPADPILGPADEKDEWSPGPQLPFTKSHAWIRIAVGADTRGGSRAAKGRSQLGLGIDGSARLVSWNRHSKTRKLGSALAEDLGSVRFALSGSDVRKLAVGDALAFEAGGSLTGSLEIRWTDVLTAGLGQLTRLLKADRTIRLNLDPGLSASMRIEVRDGFLLTFARPRSGQLRVAVRKADRSEVSAQVEAGIRAEFADPRSLQTVLENLYQNLFGSTQRKIDRLVAKTRLSEADRELLARISEVLGIDEWLEWQEQLDKLSRRWEGFKADAARTIEAIAVAKAELGFSYEYARIETGRSILQFRVEDDRIRRLHRDLIRGDISSSLSALRDGDDGLTAERFLQQKTVDIRRAWGFTLGVAGHSIRGRDQRVLEQISRENLDGAKQIAFRGMRGYEGRFLQSVDRWFVDLDATLPDYVAGPTLADFRYGLTLSYAWERKRFSNAAVLRLADQAVMWRAVATEDQEQFAADLRKRLQAKRSQLVRIEIRIDDAAVRALLARIEDTPEERFGKALATSMPWNRDRVRRDLWRRRRFYGELWQQYLESRSAGARTMRRRAEEKARDWGLSGMARQERDPDDARFAYTLGGMIRVNAALDETSRNTRTRYRAMRRGLSAWASALDPDSAGSPEELQPVFRDLSRFWSISHHARAFGVYCLDLLRDIGAPGKDGVQRVLVVEDTGRGKRREDLIVTQS